MYRYRLGRIRVLALAATFGLVYFYLRSGATPSTSTSLAGHTQLESLRLQEFMNDNASIHSPSEGYKKSSFDWSSVKHTYPPGDGTRLPSGKADALPRVQYSFKPESAADAKLRESRRDQVRDLFKQDWAAYRKYAWMKDALKPLSGTYQDQFSGWSATLVDALDTLWIMGLKEEFDEAVDAVASIDFGRSTSATVNTFETNIRYLGGLMAAYDLSRRPVLLEKARELGDLLYGAFNTPNSMPVDFILFDQAKRGDGLQVENSVVSASPGTLSLEMTRLSQLTGDPKYYTAMMRVMQLFHDGQPKTQLPGMWPMFVSMAAKDVVSGNTFTLAGCADSLYEYLPKMHALLGGREPIFSRMTKSFMEAANKHLFFRPMLPANNDVLISGNVNVDDAGGVSLDPESEHLACYIGGVFALGGRLFGRSDYVETGEKLTKGCIYAYRAMPTGMMPERYNMVACSSRSSCRWDEKRWVEERAKRSEWKEHLPKGFTTAKDPRYILRPEAIESVFVLWRVTGKKEYQEAAWDMFTAVSSGTRTELAHAAVKDVTKAKDELPHEDYMESFWFAETLKYFYLALSPPDLISLDEYVLNTEAHPFIRSK